MSLKSILQRFGLAIGLLELAPSQPDAKIEIVVIPSADAFEGTIRTAHDVLVKGSASGAILSPNKTVEVTDGGCVDGEEIQARNFIWRGTLGVVKVTCRDLVIDASARNAVGMPAPDISYETLHINDCSNVSVNLKWQPYATAADDVPDSPANHDFTEPTH